MNMRKSVIVITLLLASAFAGRAQQKATFTYGADFQYYFDNREYDGAGNKFETSGTVHAARLTPTVGVKVAGRPVHPSAYARNRCDEEYG